MRGPREAGNWRPSKRFFLEQHASEGADAGPSYEAVTAPFPHSLTSCPSFLPQQHSFLPSRRPPPLLSSVLSRLLFLPSFPYSLRPLPMLPFFHPSLHPIPSLYLPYLPSCLRPLPLLPSFPSSSHSFLAIFPPAISSSSSLRLIPPFPPTSSSPDLAVVCVASFNKLRPIFSLRFIGRKRQREA